MGSTRKFGNAKAIPSNYCDESTRRPEKKTIIFIEEEAKERFYKVLEDKGKSDIVMQMKATGFKLTASLGVAYDDNGLSKEALIGRADDAMYIAKTSGKNQVQMWVPKK